MMTRTTAPAWLPDWRNESEYTDHGDDLEAWAWEFLRRNPDYQADFARWAALPEEWTVDGISKLSPKYDSSVGEFTPMLYCQPAADHQAKACETAGDYEKRTRQWPETLYTALPIRWGIEQLQDPASDAVPATDIQIRQAMPPYLPFRPDDAFDFGPRAGMGMEWTSGRCLVAQWPEEIDRHIVTISFDLRYPVEDQLAEARKLLKHEDDPEARPWLAADVWQEQPKIRRKGIPQEKKRLQILRVLDAELSGATADEVMAELYDGKALKTGNKAEVEDEMQRYRESFGSWHKEKLRDARELMHGRYKNLLKWHQLPTS